jgi:hypothetical protein
LQLQDFFHGRLLTIPPIDNHPQPSVKMAKEATARSGLIVGINKGHVR